MAAPHAQAQLQALQALLQDVSRHPGTATAAHAGMRTPPTTSAPTPTPTLKPEWSWMYNQQGSLIDPSGTGKGITTPYSYPSQDPNYWAHIGDPKPVPTGHAPGGGEGNKPPWYQTIPLGWVFENLLRALRDTGVGRQPKMP